MVCRRSTSLDRVLGAQDSQAVDCEFADRHFLKNIQSHVFVGLLKLVRPAFGVGSLAALKRLLS